MLPDIQYIERQISRVEQTKLIINYRYDEIAIYSGFQDCYGFTYNSNVQEQYKQNTYYLNQEINVFSSVPRQAFINLQSILVNGMIGVGDDWFDVGFDPLSQAGAIQTPVESRGLQQIKNTLKAYLYNKDANFYSAMSYAFLECSLFGNGIVQIKFDHPNAPIRFQPVRFSEYYAEQNLDGEVHINFRKRTVSIAELKASYPNADVLDAGAYGNASVLIYEYAQKNPSFDHKKAITSKNPKWIYVVLIGKVSTRRMSPTTTMAMKEANSTYLVLESRPMSFNPFTLFRFAKNPSYIYGTGLGHVLVNDMIELQDHYMKWSIAGNNRAIKPIIVSSSLKNVKNSLNIQSNGITLGGLGPKGEPLIQTLDLSDDPTPLLDMIAKKERDIQNACLNDENQFIKQQGNPPTAYEVQERQLAKQARASVNFSNIKDGLDDLISNCLDFLHRTDAIAIPNQTDKKKNLKVVYKAPLFNQEKVRTISGVSQVMTAMQPLIQADPELIYRLNPTPLLMDMFKGAGLNLEGLRSEEEVNAIMAQRQAIAQQQQQAETLATQADANLKEAQARQIAGGLGEDVR